MSVPEAPYLSDSIRAAATDPEMTDEHFITRVAHMLHVADTLTRQANDPAIKAFDRRALLLNRQMNDLQLCDLILARQIVYPDLCIAGIYSQGMQRWADLTEQGVWR